MKVDCKKDKAKKKLLPSIRQIASRLRKLKKTGIYDITTTSGLMAFAHTRMMENFDMSKLSEDELASWGGEDFETVVLKVSPHKFPRFITHIHLITISYNIPNLRAVCSYRLASRPGRAEIAILK